MILFLSFLFLIRKRYYQTNPAVFSIAAFVIGSGFLVSLQRSLYGPQQVFASRYSFWSALFIAVLWIAFVEMYPAFSKKVAPYFLTLTICFNAFSMGNTYTYMRNHVTDLRFGTYLSYYRPDTVVLLNGNDKEYEHNAYLSAYLEFFKEAVAAKVLLMPVAELRKTIGSGELSPSTLADSEEVEGQITQMHSDDVFLEVEFSVSEPLANSTLGVCVGQDGKQRCFTAVALSKHPAHRDIIKHYYKSLDDYVALIPRDAIIKDSHSIRFVRMAR